MSAYSDLILSRSPVAYWRLGEVSGTTAADQVGAFPGTYVGGVTLGNAGALSGDADTAPAFDGTGRVTGSTTPILNAATTWTVEAWVNTTASSISGARSIYCERASFGPNILKLKALDVNFPSKAFITYRNDDRLILQVIGTSSIDDGAWHHVVGVRNGTAVRLYVDGVEETLATWSGTNTFTDPGRESWIGQDKGSSVSPYWVGGIDEVAIHNTALTAAQIAEHYDMGVNGPPPSGMSLLLRRRRAAY